RAASIYADLTVQEARRRELEADVARLEEEYQTSRMTREQLASRLAQTEAELAMMADREKSLGVRLQKQLDDAHTLRSANEQLSNERKQLVTRADELAGELERQRARRGEAEGSVAQLREQLKRETDALQLARARITELEDRIATLRQTTTPPPVERPNKHG